MRIKKSALTLALALAVVFGIMIGANAADTVKTIIATLNYGITVKYNGETQELKDANGNRVYPISYEGTTYLPVRAVANLLGIEVNWDGPTNTVWLGEGFVPTPSTPSSSSGGVYTVGGGKIGTHIDPVFGIEVMDGWHVEKVKDGKAKIVNDETGATLILGGFEGYVAGTGQITSDPVDLPEGWGFTNG